MNRALWRKAWHDAWPLMLGCCAIVFAFAWLFIRLSSAMKLPDFSAVLDKLPEQWKRLSGVPAEDLATHVGRVAIIYVDPLVVITAGLWSMARGSDAVSGEIGRGTMELLLAQPVRRMAILWPQIVVTTIGAFTIALATWLGTCVGLATTHLEGPVDPWAFIPATLNLAWQGFFLAGFSTLVSACGRFRGTTIGILGAFYVVELILKVIARISDDGQWLNLFTFFGAYEPQVLVRDAHEAWTVLAGYTAVLGGFGLACYVAAAIIFCRRDIPAPV